MALYSDAAGRPLTKIYKRVGIRRDRNFSDVSSASDSLENLLDKLINDTGNTFLSTDLDAIKNIFDNPTPCNDIKWQLFGLSIPMYTFILF